MTPVTDLALAGIIDDPTGVNSATVLAIATELQAFRAADGATPPDVQHYTFPSPGTGGVEYQIQINRIQLERLGMQWMRVTRHDGKLYFDGWKYRPRKEPPFRVLPPAEKLATVKPTFNAWIAPVDITGASGEAF